jgi:hypothetical protein
LRPLAAAILLTLALPSAAQSDRPQRRPAPGDGPWSHRILLARSEDGLSWTADDHVLAESASVPELFEGPDGRAIVLFVDGLKQKTGALRERADGTWERVESNLPGVDPCVVKVADRRWRAWVKAGLDGAVDVHESADGLTWTRLGECFRDPAYPNATDPDVFRTKVGWVMLLSLGPRLLRCTSDDGLAFEAGETLELGGSVSDTVAVDGGWRTFFHVNAAPPSGKMHIRSAFTADGRTWKAEDGVRLAAPAQGPAARGVADPAPLRRRDGTWLMAVKSFMEPESAPEGPEGRGGDPELRRRLEELQKRLDELEERLRELEAK